MKVGLFSDPHYCHIEIPSPRRFTLSYKKITEAMDYFKAEGVELVLCLGDLVDDCRNYEDNVESIGKIVGLIRSYGIPFYSLMGNHDYQNFTREEFNRLTGGAYPPVRMTAGKSTLLFLDCNYGDDGHVYEPGKVNWIDTRLPEEQLAYLEHALSDPLVEEAYVFSHQSVEDQVDGNHIVHNAADIRAVLSASGKVRAMIQGHYHPGHDTVIDGVHYHTLPAMCEGEKNYYEIMIVE